MTAESSGREVRSARPGPGTSVSSVRTSLPDLGKRGDGPLVSVVVPTYGDDEFVGRALRSVADQTYGSVEIVVVDSSGVDWLASLADDTCGVDYVYQEPSGLAAARNRGIEAASGKFVGFLDADDRWHPEKLERQVPALESGADVVYSDVTVVTDDGDSRYLSSLPVEDPASHHLDFLYEGGVPIPTVVARRECLDAEPFDESLPAVEDRNLLARLFRLYEPARIPEALATYRQRNDSMSSDAATMYRSELQSLDSLVRRFPELGDHERALRARAEYAYGKRLLRTGDPARARRRLLAAARDGLRDRRVVALLGLSLLPVDHQRALWWLERHPA